MNQRWHWHVFTTSDSRVAVRKVRCGSLFCISGLTTFEQARGEAIKRAATLRLKAAERRQDDYLLAGE